ncbi:hypothetical protein CFOL_v3_28201 [Cephalotus follicularis]|uniref:Uncharacterized protein n=1 Tax=Cephalotus follicularis TaxID=3775 RepID=A0A1Q3CX04_CEPFO|nr:hypothetical protein CFOL_v3_28201 [Cephalotus follicularis]
MVTTQYSVTTTVDQKLRPKLGRKPLQPKNITETPTYTKPKPKQECLEMSLIVDSNKENHDPTKFEPSDSSLAEELSAIRKKLERLRSDREITEKMLRDRDLVLDMQMKEMELRGEIQNQLEIQVDRLYRLNQLKSYSMRVSSIRSLREKEQHKKMSEASSSSQEVKAENFEESIDENQLQSPSTRPWISTPTRKFWGRLPSFLRSSFAHKIAGFLTHLISEFKRAHFGHPTQTARRRT